MRRAICTALRWLSIRLMAFSSAPGADEIDALDRASCRSRRRAVRARNPAAGRCGWPALPAMTPDNTTASLSPARPSSVEGAARRGSTGAIASGGGSHDGGDSSNAIAYSIARSSNVAWSCAHCSSSSESSHAPSPRLASALDSRVERRLAASAGARSVNASFARRASPSASASSRAPASSNAGHRRQVELGVRGLLGDRPAQRPRSASRCRAVSLPVIATIAAGGLRCARRAGAAFPAGRRALELHDVLERELVERIAVAGALQQVEQREPGERRLLACRGRSRRPARAASRAGGAWPLAYSSAAFSSTAHSPGLACATSIAGVLRRPFDQARAGDRTSLRVDRLELPPVAAPSRPPCAASSRAETGSGPRPAGGRLGGTDAGLAGGLGEASSPAVWRTGPSNRRLCACHRAHKRADELD